MEDKEDIEKIDIKFSPDIRNWFENETKSEPETEVLTLNWFDHLR